MNASCGGWNGSIADSGRAPLGAVTVPAPIAAVGDRPRAPSVLTAPAAGTAGWTRRRPARDRITATAAGADSGRCGRRRPAPAPIPAVRRPAAAVTAGADSGRAARRSDRVRTCRRFRPCAACPGACAPPRAARAHAVPALCVSRVRQLVPILTLVKEFTCVERRARYDMVC